MKPNGSIIIKFPFFFFAINIKSIDRFLTRDISQIQPKWHLKIKLIFCACNNIIMHYLLIDFPPELITKPHLILNKWKRFMWIYCLSFNSYKTLPIICITVLWVSPKGHIHVAPSDGFKILDWMFWPPTGSSFEEKENLVFLSCAWMKHMWSASSTIRQASKSMKRNIYLYTPCIKVSEKSKKYIGTIVKNVMHHHQ